MKCSYCQSDLPNGAIVCPVCGAPIGCGSPYGGAQSATYVRPPYPTSVEIIKQTAKHKLFLAATILLTVCTAISALYNYNLDALSILMTIGAWMFYAEGRKETSDPYTMSISSLKILKATKTITLVMLWIIAVCAGILIIALPFIGDAIIDSFNYNAGGFSVSPFYSDTEIGPFMILLKDYIVLAMILIAAVVAIALTISFIYVIGLRNYYRSAIESAETGLRPKKLSKAAPIMLIVSESLGAVSTLSYLFYDPVTFISLVAKTVSMIFFAIILLDAKKRSDNAYYPNEAEVHYNKICYHQYMNAQSYGQFGGYGYTNQYPGGQPAQQTYQPPFNIPPKQPNDNQPQQ